MRRHFEVMITWMDDKEAKIPHVTETCVADGALHLNSRDSFSGFNTHLGSFPLVNIRKWVREDQ